MITSGMFASGDSAADGGGVGSLTSVIWVDVDIVHDDDDSTSLVDAGHSK